MLHYNRHTLASPAHLNATLCTMRTVIILALVGACLCSRCFTNFKRQINCENPDPNKYSKDENCMEKTIQGNTGATVMLGCVYCQQNNYQDELKERSVSGAKEDLGTFARCVGCTHHPSLTDVGFTEEAASDEILRLSAILLEQVSISQISSLACNLLNELSFLKCIDDLSQENKRDLTENVSKLQCQRDVEESHAATVVNALARSSCVSRDLRDTDGESKENLIALVTSLGEEHVGTLFRLLQTVLGVEDTCGLGEISK